MARRLELMKDLLYSTKDLVRIPSVSNEQTELNRIVDYVETFFADLNTDHLFITRYTSNGIPSIVIASEKENLEPHILLLGHLDVVPADEALFDPIEKNGMLYGRGVCDMKSEVAVMMDLARELALSSKPLPSFALMLTCDEEVGGFDGTDYLINEVGYKPHVALVPDGGTSPATLMLMNKGVFHAQLTATGQTAHGSRPWLGENAIDKLIRDYKRIREHFDALDQSDTQDRWYHTCSIGTIEGGHATNQIPDHASCKLDIRMTEDTTVEEMNELLEGLLQETTLERLVTANPSTTHRDHPYVHLYEKVLQDSLQEQMDDGKCCGSDDGRFLTDHGIPVIVSRPISDGQHSPEEWVNMQSLHDFRRLYGEYVRALARHIEQEEQTTGE